MPEDHIERFSAAVVEVCKGLSHKKVEQLAKELFVLREKGGRLFILGVGGSAANSSHAVNDFRKLCAIETYAPTDNVSELTARTNDNGWDSVFIDWLRVSKFNSNDAILIYSVGGGNEENKISVNLIKAIIYAKQIGGKVFGIVGKSDGYTALHAHIAICIPVIEPSWVTPISEAFQGVVLHMLVSHPLLQRNETKW
jgi:D-sedoheptulose 7-phosphate isomerase